MLFDDPLYVKFDNRIFVQPEFRTQNVASLTGYTRRSGCDLKGRDRPPLREKWGKKASPSLTTSRALIWPTYSSPRHSSAFCAIGVFSSDFAALELT